MYRIILLLVIFCSGNIAIAQSKPTSSIQDAVNQHLSELKKHLAGYDNIFLLTKVDDQLSVSEKVWKVENGLNAKMLKKKDKNYLVVVKVSSQSEYLKIDMINYSVAKISNKELKLINLNNGGTYIVER